MGDVLEFELEGDSSTSINVRVDPDNIVFHMNVYLNANQIAFDSMIGAAT